MTDNGRINVYDNRLIYELGAKGIYIYGAGYVAELFWKVLEKYELISNVKGVLVTHLDGNIHCFHGMKVDEYENYVENKNDIICVAVHEAIYSSIELFLRERQCRHYIWVAPYITDSIMAGQCIKSVYYPIKEIFVHETDNLGLAIKILAIDQYYEANEYGYSMYLRGMNIFCDKNTARARLDSFIENIKKTEKLKEIEKPVCIDKEKRIIDGEHRFSIAIYFHIPNIYCKVYDCDNYHMDNSGLKEGLLRNNGFDDCEIQLLKGVLNKYLEAVG